MMPFLPPGCHLEACLGVPRRGGEGEVTGSLQAKPMELRPPGTPWEGSVLISDISSDVKPNSTLDLGSSTLAQHLQGSSRSALKGWEDQRSSDLFGTG